MGTIIFSRYVILCIAMVASGIMVASGGVLAVAGIALALGNGSLYWHNMRDGVYG